MHRTEAQIPVRQTLWNNIRWFKDTTRARFLFFKKIIKKQKPKDNRNRGGGGEKTKGYKLLFSLLVLTHTEVIEFKSVRKTKAKHTYKSPGSQFSKMNPKPNPI